MWDPEEGAIRVLSPNKFERPDIQPIDLPTGPFDSRCTSTFALFQDTFQDTFQSTPHQSQRYRHNHSQTVASSTNGGLDLYTREYNPSSHIKPNVHYSCFDDLDAEMTFDARLAFSLEESLDPDRASFSDEGFFDGPLEGNKSAINLVCLSLYKYTDLILR